MSAILVQALQGQWGARLIETHVSWVLLDGVHAWKIKKPVNLGFLDFSALETRKAMCETECRLNQRLAPSLYLDVLPIRGTPEQPCLDGLSAPIEYVLRMKQFEPGTLFSERLTAGTLAPEHIEHLAHRLAAFHRKACVAGADTPFGNPQDIEQAVAQVAEGLMQRGAPQIKTALWPWLQTQAVALRSTWVQRKAQGHVVEGHGDLHLANVVVLGEDVTAFDCIEFDPALRWIDVHSDIAFLVMDLQAHRRPDLAYRFLNAYLDDSGDHNGLPTLRYYLVYRALVRALVAHIRTAQDALASPDYLALAQRLTQPAGARLLITHGVSGSGKSYWTQRLLACTQAIRLRSDVERRRLGASLPADQRHAPQTSQRTYDLLRDKAAMALAAGYPVIVDATFLDAGERASFRALAHDMQVPFTILHCRASTDTLRARVSARLRRGDDASDADLLVLQAQLARKETLGEDEWPHTLTVDADAPVPVETLAARWLDQRHSGQTELP